MAEGDSKPDKLKNQMSRPREDISLINVVKRTNLQRFLSERPNATAFEMIERATRVVGLGNFFVGLTFLFQESSFVIKCHTIVKPSYEVGRSKHQIKNSHLDLDDSGRPIDHGLASKRSDTHGDETRYWLITICKKKNVMRFEHPMYLYSDGLSFVAELSEKLMLPDCRCHDTRDRFLWPVKVPAPIEVAIGPFSNEFFPNEFGTTYCEQSTMALFPALKRYAGITEPVMVNSLTPKKTLPGPDTNCVKVVMESMIDGLGVNLVRVPKGLPFSNFLKRVSCPDFPLARAVDPFTYIKRGGKIEFRRPTAKEKSHSKINGNKTFPCQYPDSFLEVTEADRAKAEVEPTENKTDYRSTNAFSYKDCDVYFTTHSNTIWIKKDTRLAILRALFSQASPHSNNGDVQYVRDAMVNATFSRTKTTKGCKRAERGEEIKRIDQVKRFAVKRIIAEYVQKLFEAVGRKNVGTDFTTTIYLEVINRYRYDLTKVVHYGTNGVFLINLPGLKFVRDYYRGQNQQNQLVYAEDLESLCESLAEDNDPANDNLGFDLTKMKSLVSLPPSEEINPETFDETCEEKMRACVRPASKDKNKWAEDITAKKICHPKGYRLKVYLEPGYHRVFKLKTKEWYALTGPGPSCLDIMERTKDDLDFLELMFPDSGYVREVMKGVENRDRDQANEANKVDENKDQDQAEVNETKRDRDLVGEDLNYYLPRPANTRWPRHMYHFWTNQIFKTLPQQTKFPCYIMYMNEMKGINRVGRDKDYWETNFNAHLDDTMAFLRDVSITPAKIIDNIMKTAKKRGWLEPNLDEYNQRIQTEIAIGMFWARQERLGNVLRRFPKEG